MQIDIYDNIPLEAVLFQTKNRRGTLVSMPGSDRERALQWAQSCLQKTRHRRPKTRLWLLQEKREAANG